MNRLISTGLVLNGPSHMLRLVKPQPLHFKPFSLHRLNPTHGSLSKKMIPLPSKSMFQTARTSPFAIITFTSSSVRRYNRPYYNYNQGGSSSSWSSQVSNTIRGGNGALIPILIGVNVAVFLAWNTYGQSNRDNQRFMFQNFTASMQNLREGRIWTLVTSCFSQMSLTHLLMNMFVLWSIGGGLLPVIGQKRFLGLYLAGGVSSSALHIAYENFYKKTRRETPALGASGSIMAVSMLFGALFPTATIYVFIFPVPAIVAVGGFIAWDLYQSFLESSRSRVSHAGHLGGALLGGLYYLALRARIR